MKINDIPEQGRQACVPLQLIRIMKLTAIIITFCLIQVSAATKAQITLNEKKAPLQKVLESISTQSGYDFIYSTQDLKGLKTGTIKLNDVDIETALKAAFESQPLQYEIADKTVMVKRKEDKSVIDRVKDFLALIDAHGRVVDEKGQPLEGVTVKLKDESLVTTTDKDGNFSLKRINDKSVLVISYIGYLTKELNAAADLGTIALEISNSKLDEVQVMAYGQTSQRLNTGDIVSVKAADIEKQPVNNPLYALQGRVPGLQVIPTTGLAGSTVNLQIRGNNSLTFATTPLIVIDGLPIAANIPSLGGTLGQLSSLNYINPNDIESIEVLKDADAASIYGSRGANGVILITTKKGKAGQTKVDVNVQNGWADVSKKVNLLNGQQYLQLRKEAYANNGVDFVNTFPYGLPPEYKYLFAPDLVLWDQTKNTDWQKTLIGRNAQYQDLQGSISGGVSTVQYIVGGNFHRETTVFPGNNDDKKGSAHFSLIGTSLNQKLRATISASYMADHNTLPGVDLTYQALTLAPNAPSLYKDDGTLNWETQPSGASTWANPLAELYRPYDAKVNNLIASADISYRLFPFLALKTQVGYNQIQGNAFKSGGTLESIPPEQITPDLYYFSDFNSNLVKNLSFEPQITLNTHIYKGLIQGLIGGSIQNTTTESQNIEAIGFKSDVLIKNLASASSFTANNTSSQYKYNALFARITYNWDNKYLFNLNARRDGSSRFGPGNQFGNFGAFGAAWIFTEEDFVHKAVPFMSFGKLRLSYGTAGNDNISDYAYLERYQPITGVGNYQGASGLSTSGIFNSYYHWETTRKLEVGLEAGFFKDRILFSVSYYRNRSDNELLTATYPSTVGPGSAVINLPAILQNKGLEISLNTTNFKLKDFNWLTSVNLTVNRNKLISFPGVAQSNYYATYEVGQPFYGVVKVFNANGVDPTTGKYQFTSIDGKTVTDPNDPSRLDGGKYLRIMTAPKFYGGISNTFAWKGITLDVFFQFTKQTGINPLSNYYQVPGLAPVNLPVAFISRWQKTGDVAQIQKLSGLFDNDLFQSGGWFASSNGGYVDASFIRLKNLSLSYSVPESWKKTLNMQNIRIYLQGQNLLTITKYKGLDPETQSMNSLPPLRVLTMGIKATF